jgi:hypothetical protein
MILRDSEGSGEQRTDAVSIHSAKAKADTKASLNNRIGSRGKRRFQTFIAIVRAPAIFKR